ncbi:MAG: hypothetical protein WAQ52_07860 [Terriglobales bacterium]
MTHDRGTNQENWRELARRIQVESDPEKMIELAQQLVATFVRTAAKEPQVGGSFRSWASMMWVSCPMSG